MLLPFLIGRRFLTHRIQACVLLARLCPLVHPYLSCFHEAQYSMPMTPLAYAGSCTSDELWKWSCWQ